MRSIEQLRGRLPTVEAIERRRSQLWYVAGFLLLSASSTVAFLLVSPGATELVPDSPGLRVGFGGLSIAFLLYVFDQERRLRRLSAALVAERVLSSLLTERVRDLATLSRVGQVVNSVLTTREVLNIILAGAHELTNASSGSVMLVDGEDLVVEVSTGEEPAPPGTRQSLDRGVAGEVAVSQEPVLVSGRVGPDQVRGRQPRRRSSGSAVIAPMLVGDQLIGVLALDRVDEAAAPIDPEPVRVAPFVAELLEVTRSMAAARDPMVRSIRAEVATELEIVTDRGVLRSVLQNLLENAVKYSPAGSPIDLVVTTSDGEVRFAVNNHGEGITEADQSVIFERFRRGRGDMTSDGVGLGLYIVRSLVAAQGGRIWVDSAPGQGATFVVALPVKVVRGKIPTRTTVGAWNVTSRWAGSPSGTGPRRGCRCCIRR